MITKEQLLYIKKQALNLRIDSIRATSSSASGHPTSCLSAADLISTVFFNFLKYDLKNPSNTNNDRFILSKGHAIPVIYAAWKNLGVISDQELLNLRKFDSFLEGHPTPRFIYNEAATGSLGQGLAIGIGMAINAKYQNLDYTTYVMMGDGEITEGSIWEAAEIAAHYKLNNLIGIVDCNRLSQSGESLQNHDIQKYTKIFDAFGWNTYTIDGHNIPEIISTFDKLLKNIKNSNKPTVIISKTYKGYGISEIENKNGYHGKPFLDEEKKYIEELKNKFKEEATFIPKIKYTPPKPTNIKIDSIKFKDIDINTDTNSNLFDMSKSISTRKAFGYALAALGKNNKNIFAIDGDVKNSTFTQIFEKQNPKNFIQCFIAEQTMIGVATGLQQRGQIPFAATFAAFLTRAHDQIRMAGVGRNALRICGSHCGVSIGEDGPSQMGLEDISMFRSIPNSIILYPSDGVSTYKLTQIMTNYNDGISYLRTMRPSTSIIYNKNEEFKIGGCKILKESNNDKICIISAGITLHESLKAYEELKKQNIFVSIIDLYSIKPLDIKTIKKIATKSGNKIITVEDHYLQGGIGESIASKLTDETINVDILSVTKIPRSGTAQELLEDQKIDCKSIIKKALNILNN
ncbi:transketolase [Candidatus Dependentiae bacterium]